MPAWAGRPSGADRAAGDRAIMRLPSVITASNLEPHAIRLLVAMGAVWVSQPSRPYYLNIQRSNWEYLEDNQRRLVVSFVVLSYSYFFTLNVMVRLRINLQPWDWSLQLLLPTAGAAYRALSFIRRPTLLCIRRCRPLWRHWRALGGERWTAQLSIPQGGFLFPAKREIGSRAARLGMMHLCDLKVQVHRWSMVRWEEIFTAKQEIPRTHDVTEG